MWIIVKQCQPLRFPSFANLHNLGKFYWEHFLLGMHILDHRYHRDFPVELQPLDKLPQVNQFQSRDFGVQHCVLERFQIYSGCSIWHLYSMTQPKRKLKAEINSIYVLSSLPLTKADVKLFSKPLTEFQFYVGLFVYMLVCF